MSVPCKGLYCVEIFLKGWTMKRFFAKGISAEQAKVMCLLCGVFVTFHEDGGVSFLGTEMTIELCREMMRPEHEASVIESVSCTRY